MNDGGVDQDEKPIGELFGQLVDDGKAFAKAELGLAKASAEAKANAAKMPALLGGAALLFLIAGVVVLCMTMALTLATLIGPLAGGLVATIITFAIAGLLGWLAKKQWEARK